MNELVFYALGYALVCVLVWFLLIRQANRHEAKQQTRARLQRLVDIKEAEAKEALRRRIERAVGPDGVELTLQALEQMDESEHLDALIRSTGGAP